MHDVFCRWDVAAMLVINAALKVVVAEEGAGVAGYSALPILVALEQIVATIHVQPLLEMLQGTGLHNALWRLYPLRSWPNDPLIPARHRGRAVDLQNPELVFSH